MVEPFEGFRIGGRYHLHEDMWPASPGFGIYIGGIAPKGRYPKTESVAILATIGEDARYGNRWDGDVLVFSGEDRRSVPDPRTSDQSPEMGGNRVLTHSPEMGVPIYCFWAKSEDDRWEYLGLGEVESWSLEPRGKRKVVEYRVALLGSASRTEAVALRREIERSVESDREPVLTEDEQRGSASAMRKLRSQVFSDRVKGAYSNKCAVCGIERRDAAGRPEVHAAHIYPVELDGADDVRNGLALCRLHHWAFDGALLGLQSDLTIRVFPKGKAVPGVAEFHGRRLAVALAEPSRRPHDLYLRARLKLSEAGWTRTSDRQSTAPSGEKTN